MKKQKMLQRRQFIQSLFAGGGYLGLRSFLLGVPPTFLTQRAMAATNPTFLVFSSRRAGDPVNANVPLTYINGIAHPGADGFSSPVNFTLGANTYSAARPWAEMPEELRQRFHFFHHSSEVSAHPENDKVLLIRGALKSQSGVGPEMLPSAIAQHTAAGLGTILDKPLLITGTDIPLTFNGISQGSFPPRSMKEVFAGGSDDKATAMMQFRDQQLDGLYQDLKASGTPAQKKFLDNHALSKNQSRLLSEQLGTLLAQVSGNSTNDQIITAAAVLASRAAPAAIIGIPFGGDNHGDTNLNAEVSQTESGVGSIVALHQQLTSLGIADQTTFALQNVFGRTLRRNDRGGRDHNRDHSVMLMFGPRVQPGVTGNLVLQNNGRGAAATGINSSNGSSNDPDISKIDTLAASAKTLMKACGLEDPEIDLRVTSGKVVRSAISS